jgi:zinc transporter 5/7
MKRLFLLIFNRLISIEITTEATERLAEGRETKRLMELFLVSCGGLAVNLVGMACFGHHGHAGHDHGSHGHGHSHAHVHEEKHTHDDHHHTHDHDRDHDHTHETHDSFLNDKPKSPQPHVGHSHGGHSHSHSHDNENMYGIWLHVLADTMGSAAVIVSTGLIYLTGWNGWDPLASCLIAILIFMSSIPLITSCAKKLLLTIPDSTEYNLRDALSSVAELRGVANYSVPRFWMGDSSAGTSESGVLGVIHVFATRGSDLEEVRERTRAHLLGQGMDVVVQVEKDGDTSCWCGGSAGRSPPTRFS